MEKERQRQREMNGTRLGRGGGLLGPLRISCGPRQISQGAECGPRSITLMAPQRIDWAPKGPDLQNQKGLKGTPRPQPAVASATGQRGCPPQGQGCFLTSCLPQGLPSLWQTVLCFTGPTLERSCSEPAPFKSPPPESLWEPSLVWGKGHPATSSKSTAPGLVLLPFPGSLWGLLNHPHSPGRSLVTV